MIKGKQQHSDKQKSDELRQDNGAACKQGRRRAPWAVRAQIALHQILIRSMRAHGQETSTNQSRPEGKRFCEVERKVEYGKLVVLGSQRKSRGQSSVDRT